MADWYWVLWCILGAILVVAEIFTSGFVLLWFGIGALAAAFMGFIGVDSLVIQFLVFALVSVSLTAASRTIFINYFSREKSGGSLRSGVDALPGKIGTVVSSSRGALQEGAVKVLVRRGPPIRRPESRRWKQANAFVLTVSKALRSM